MSRPIPVGRMGDMAEWFKKTTLGALVDHAARRFGPREALYFQGKRWTFSQLREEVDRAARALIDAGVQPGEKVSLWAPNQPEWIHILFAVAKIGAVLVPINTRFRTADMEYVVRQSDSGTLITVDRSGPVDYVDMVRQVCPELEHGNPDDLRIDTFPQLKRVLVIGDRRYPGTCCWADILEAGATVPQSEVEARQHRVDPDDTVLIMYTSGTTGFPKGVMHNHNLIRNVTDEANRMGMTPSDVILMYLPLFHAFGFYEGPLMSMLVGARTVLTTSFDSEESLKLIEVEKVTVLHGFDTHFDDLMSHPNCETTGRSSLRTGILAAGMASNEQVARRAQKQLFRTVTAWEMTEVGVGASMSFLDTCEDDRCLGSGYPLPGYEFKVVVPATAESLPFGTMGEMCVRSYMVMQGYYNKPEETAKAVDTHGWLHSGDVGTIREDGYIRFIGRYKELLKVGGENVDPVEVEALLLGHPYVGKVQVVGVPDRRLSEVACACVVPREGREVTADELVDFFLGKLASFKLPRHVLFMDEYPMTPSGKVQKYQLRELALEALGLSQE